ERVRWVVGMHHIEAVPHGDANSEREAGQHSVPVFEYVPKETITCEPGPIAPDTYAVLDGLDSGAGPRAYDVDVISVRGQRLRLLAHTHVAGVVVVLQQHEYTSAHLLRFSHREK